MSEEQLRAEVERKGRIIESLTHANNNLKDRVRDLVREVARLGVLVTMEREIGDEVDERLSARVESAEAERDVLQQRLDAVQALPERWQFTVEYVLGQHRTPGTTAARMFAEDCIRDLRAALDAPPVPSQPASAKSIRAVAAALGLPPWCREPIGPLGCSRLVGHDGPCNPHAWEGQGQCLRPITETVTSATASAEPAKPAEWVSGLCGLPKGHSGGCRPQQDEPARAGE